MNLKKQDIFEKKRELRDAIKRKQERMRLLSDLNERFMRLWDWDYSSKY